MERCPICRALLNGASTCRRCHAELAQVQKVTELASDLAGAAMLCLARGHTAEANRLLARARLLHATPEVLALLLRLRPFPNGTEHLVKGGFGQRGAWTG
jgi:hypothetical protein